MNKSLKSKQPPKITDVKRQAYAAALEKKITNFITKNAEMKVEIFSLKEENKRLIKIIKDSGGDFEDHAEKRRKAWGISQKQRTKSTGKSEQKPTKKVSHF